MPHNGLKLPNMAFVVFILGLNIRFCTWIALVLHFFLLRRRFMTTVAKMSIEQNLSLVQIYQSIGGSIEPNLRHGGSDHIALYLR